jgi:hypothetical protein
MLLYVSNGCRPGTVVAENKNTRNHQTRYFLSMKETAAFSVCAHSLFMAFSVLLRDKILKHIN